MHGLKSSINKQSQCIRVREIFGFQKEKGGSHLELNPNYHYNLQVIKQ